MNTRFCILKAVVIAAAMILGSSEATSAGVLPAFVDDAVQTDAVQTTIVEIGVDDSDLAACEDSPAVDLISPFLVTPAQQPLSPALLVDALDELFDENSEEGPEGEAVDAKAVPEPTSLGLIALGGLLSVMVVARYRMG